MVRIYSVYKYIYIYIQVCIWVCLCVWVFFRTCLYLYWPPSISTSRPFSMSILYTYIYQRKLSWQTSELRRSKYQYHDNWKGKVTERKSMKKSQKNAWVNPIVSIYISTLSNLTHLHVAASSCTARDRCTTRPWGGRGRHRSTAVLGPMPSW